MSICYIMILQLVFKAQDCGPLLPPLVKGFAETLAFAAVWDGPQRMEVFLIIFKFQRGYSAFPWRCSGRSLTSRVLGTQKQWYSRGGSSQIFYRIPSLTTEAQRLMRISATARIIQCRIEEVRALVSVLNVHEGPWSPSGARNRCITAIL